MRKPRDPIYSVWGTMIQRCHNPRNRQYKDYGGRGIGVCERWRNSFHAFASDMGPRPSGDFSVERKDNDAGYSPSNCHWATRAEQNSNKRNCIHVLSVSGRRITLREYCRQHGMPYRPVVKRIKDRKWPLELALTLPVGDQGDKGADLLNLWDHVEQLRDHLRVALDAADGRPVSDHVLSLGRKLCDSTPDFRYA
jgi:hypothetical protein